MHDAQKTNAQLIHELAELRLKVTALEAADTDRKRMEEALRKSETQLRAIFDATPFPIALVDVQDNKIDFWSRSALTLFGHTAPTTTEWYQIAYPDPDYRREVIERWKPSLEKARLSGQAVNAGEYRVTCRNGSVRICELYAVFLADRLIVTFNDITERKQAEEALRQSENQLRMITDNVPAYIAYVDSDCRYRFLNKAHEALFGKSRADILGRRLRDVLGDAYYEQSLDNIQRALSGQRVFFEAPLSVNERHLFISVAYIPDTDENGVTHGVYVLAHDITGRKRAEEALEKSKHALQKINNFLDEGERIANFGTWDWNFNTNDAWWSEGLYAIYGRNPLSGPPSYEENQWLQEAIHPDDRERLLHAVQGSIRHQTKYDIEYRLFRYNDGHERWIHAEGEILCDSKGNPERLIGIAQDITERKHAEEHLRRMNERFALATRAARLGVWDWDIQRNKLIWDDHMYELYGVSREDFPGAYEAWLHGVHPDDRESSNAVSEQARRGERDYDTEFRIVWPDGTIRVLKAYGQVVRDAAGNPVRMTGINYDITERKQAEERLKTSLAEKEVLLRELYHRTKNTLQVIRAMLLLQAARTPENAGVQKLVQDTENRILAIALVHQKLYQSQDLSRINLTDYLRELAQLIMQSYGAASQRIALIFDSDEDISVLLDTAIPCGLMVNELLTNALKYAFPDGRPGEISLRVFRNQSGKLEVHIVDNGVGVPDGFEFRAQESLGLQTVFAIAEQQMQGTVRCISEQGVTCIIEFPDTLYTERV